MYNYNQSAIAIADENEYSEFANNVLYDEMKLHLFSLMSYTSHDMS